MPHSAAGLLRGGPICFTGSRKSARAAPPRLLRAAAADPAATNSSVRIDTQADGTVTYRFGVEAESEASKNPAAAVPAAPVQPAEKPAPVAVSLDAPFAAQQFAPVQQAVAVASSSSGSSSSSSNGAVAVLASPPAAGSPPLAVLPPLPLEVLSQNSANPSNGTGSGSSGSEEAAVGASSLSGSGSNGSSRTPEPSQRQQQQQQPPPPVVPPAAIPSTSSRQPAAGQQRGTNGAVRTPGGQQQAPQGQQRRRRSASAPPPDARAIDYTTAEAYTIMVTYEDLCDQSNLDEALHLIKECIRAGRSDVLAMLRHYRFLRPAASVRAVKQALRFVQLLPRQYVDARTYNMLLRVCARAGDLRNALHVTDMLQAAGLKMDNILYTTLISACAGAGDAEKAFLLFSEMKANGVPADRMVYASVVKACAENISRLPQSERRQQLVLLERAFNLVEDMKGARIPTDAAVWNALVMAAGRAGQLQRAFNVLEDMLLTGTRPNDRTYASVIDACARAGDKELALRVYRKAQREGCAATLMVYSAAVNACVQAREGCDSDGAMAVYADMQRNGVEPDNQLYGMLMKAAGAAGNIDLALGLNDEMQREGLRPCRGTQSTLMSVFIRNSQLGEAQRIYRSLRSAGEWPQAYALNALLNCYANSFRLGDVVSLVCDMSEAGMRPDNFTFSAILNACQRADEAELALDVARLMKQRGIRMDETCAVMVLRMCYNRLRQAWVPGGYPPHRPEVGGGPSSALPGTKRSQERQRLLEALTPRGQQVELRDQGEVAWLSQAFGVYREAVGAGVRPSMRMLNRVLMCLRVAWEGKQSFGEGGAPGSLMADSLLPHHVPGPAGGAGAGVPRQEKIGVESVYHVQAVSILEEAIISNVVPSFKTDSDEPIDLRSMPPAVAEVYALTVLSAMQRLCEARRVVTTNIVFLVPEYDGSKVFMPSHLAHIDYEQIDTVPGAESAAVSSSEEEEDYGDEYEYDSYDDSDAAFSRASAGAEGAAAATGQHGDERTGLGVAGVLRRLQLWAREYGERGFILLEGKEITRWCRAMQRAVDRRSTSGMGVSYGQTYGQSLTGRTGLQQQQNQIRSSGW